MNQKAILIVALRVTALILLVGTIDDIGQVVIFEPKMFELGGGYGNGQEELIIDYYILIPLIAKIVLITILWFFPTLLLNKISGLPKDDVYPTAESFMMPIVALMGLYFVLMSAMSILEIMFHPIFGQGLNLGGFFLVPIVVRLIVGLWLLLGNQGITHLIYKLRSTKAK